MLEIIYKPYSIIDQEWQEICKRLKEAQQNLYSSQNPIFEKYPSDEMWNKYIEAQDAYEVVKKEFNEYRSTVRSKD